MVTCALNARQLFGVDMCWICGCADHVGLGNERDDDINGGDPVKNEKSSFKWIRG